MDNYQTVQSGSDSIYKKDVSEQIIMFPQMPRKLYGLKEIKQIAQSWGAISSGNVSRSKDALKLAAHGLPAVGGWIFSNHECLIEFKKNHGTVNFTNKSLPYGPLAFSGWRSCSWKARAFYLQLLSFRVFDESRYTMAQISDRTTREDSQVRKFVSRIDCLLDMESNRHIGQQVIYLNSEGKIYTPQLQVSEGAMA
jgi:hypothetical protein